MSGLDRHLGCTTVKKIGLAPPLSRPVVGRRPSLRCPVLARVMGYLKGVVAMPTDWREVVGDRRLGDDPRGYDGP